MPSLLAAAALSGGPLLLNIPLPSSLSASAPQSCVGGCYFVREAVGILNSLVIISGEMRVMVAQQQQGEVTQCQISAEVPSVSPRFARHCSSCSSHSGWRRVVGRAFYDFCLVGDFYATQNVTANKSSWFQDPGAAHEWEESTSVVQLPLWGGFGFWRAEAAPPCHPIVSLGLQRIGFGSRFK